MTGKQCLLVDAKTKTHYVYYAMKRTRVAEFVYRLTAWRQFSYPQPFVTFEREVSIDEARRLFPGGLLDAQRAKYSAIDLSKRTSVVNVYAPLEVVVDPTLPAPTSGF